MKKILILEKKISGRSSDFDHVFSFWPNQADSFPHHYMSIQQAEDISFRIFSLLMEALSDDSAKAHFIYRGVNLLWCFKKILFNFFYHVCLRYETLKLLIERYPEAHFYLQRRSSDLQRPFLDYIIQSSPLNGSPNIHFSSDTNPDEIIEAKPPQRDLKDFWPALLKRGNIASAEVLIYSDFEKSKAVLRKLKPASSLYYTDVRAPKLFLRSLHTDFAFFQAAYDVREEDFYLRKTESFIQQLESPRLFSNYPLGELRGDVLLVNRLKELFKSRLPRLLFDIDQMHRLFQETKLAKSALLDEDIAPAKNAFCQVARQYQIRTYVECHGALGHEAGFVPLTADMIFVWGDAQKRKLIRWGCSESQILISGCTRYGYYKNMDSEAVRKKIGRRLGLDESKKIALVAFPPIVQDHPRIFAQKWVEIAYEMLEIISGCPQIQFVLKIKAGTGDENQDRFCDWIQQNKLRHLFVVEKCDPLLLAKAADFLIVFNSTSAIEGFAFGKPVIALYDGWHRTLDEFREFRAFHFVRTKEELAQTLQGLIEERLRMVPEEWQRAQKECLNLPAEREPEEIVAAHLRGEVGILSLVNRG